MVKKLYCILKEQFVNIKQFKELIINIKQFKELINIKQFKELIKQFKLVKFIKRLKFILIIMTINEQPIFRRLNIQFFIKLFLKRHIRYIFFQLGYSQYICRHILKEYIRFNVQRRNNQFFFFQLERIRCGLFIHIQHILFHKEYIQFWTLL